MSTSELACVYASLILHDDGLDITGDNITTLIKAAGVTVEPYWPGLFAKLFEKRSIGDLITNVGAGGGGAVAAGGGGGGAAAGGGGAAAEEKKEEKKDEEEEEEDDDMGFSLFD
ncbi:ribosomal protein 60S [Coccomyxa subellipsoidea C-169]|uniref:Ribosomal protein 60S n=1 Tax=Coccomyxa subellipsoidea (strain C-169) TaxID=574566 RepID=I0Z1Z3_COCSC|nr:ribosomal protein 60S [Coccomyxa subellipsoidea C-169]EIE24662.1 ribosomal protein 60S [Coccomyxa subellipsoidea C-169]|eukprot:XP_005649206.1 ribosomal protein 60S [Coccomyxa subellipsoidea C-169]